MNPVVHFELPYQDRERAERFYATAFGWETQFLGPDMGDYVLATAADFIDSEGNRLSMLEPIPPRSERGNEEAPSNE